jgi:hypothetical protein
MGRRAICGRRFGHVPRRRGHVLVHEPDEEWDMLLEPNPPRLVPEDEWDTPDDPVARETPPLVPE